MSKTAIVMAYAALLACGSLQAQASDWQYEMRLVDYMNVYDFPEELLAFPFTCPPNTVRKEHLLLQRAGSDSPVEYQLSDIVENGGYLTSATVHFRSDLPRGASRLFRLIHDPSYTMAFTPRVTWSDEADGTAVVAAGLQQIRVPAGGAVDVTNPGPILGISRDGGATWVARSALVLSQGVLLQNVRGAIVEQGPLFITYRLVYTFNADRVWQVDLTVQHGEKHVLVDESLGGFVPEDASFWKFSFQQGLEPDSRLVMCNGGYNAGERGQYCGAYDRDLRSDGALPYQLGLYTPNSYGVMRSTAFYQDQGDHALLFAVNRPAEWITPARRVWSDMDAPENLYFYRSAGDSYARLALLGRERHWALGLVPREELVIRELPVTPADQTRAQQKNPLREYRVCQSLEGYPSINRQQFGAGPEVRLWQRLTDFSLNAYKDMVFDFDEPLTPYDPKGEKYSYEDYWLNGKSGGNLRGRLYELIQRYWDVSGALQERWQYFAPYADSRADWTEQQRRRIRSILIFIANFAGADSFMPQTSMMAGHPNFVSMVKPDLLQAATIFPNHPHAALWKHAFIAYWNEWVDVYTRRANPGSNTYGGRWMENVACYWMASLMNASYAADAMFHCDNTQLFDNPVIRDLVRWTLDTLAPSEGPARRLVPIGAHARGDVEGDRIRQAAQLLEKSDPSLAQQLLWCLTAGKEGTRPELRSRLYTDYGAVMWYDPDGPHEAFLTVQQLNGRGYRWTTESNGALYYATKGHRWSWNGAEQNGDNFDINLVPLFSLHGKSLGAHEVDGLLYDFDFAQYYRAAGSNPAYPWRGVMMLRDDYLAIYDHVADPEARGTFQWWNYESYLHAEYFAGETFSDLKETCVLRERFPLKWDWGEAAPLESMEPGPFSIRWTGMLLPDTTGEYAVTAEVTAGDTARVWINDQLVYDTGAAASIRMALSQGQFADLRVEFIHRTGPARINVKWGTGELLQPNYAAVCHRMPMPKVYPVKSGAGDQLHIVAPEEHRVQPKPYGALIDGKEYVFCSDAPVTINDGPAAFLGTTGYAREGQVAIFEGERASFQDLALERLSGDFGISAQTRGKGTIAGRVVGCSGGTVRLTPPAGFDARHCKVKMGATVIPHRVDGTALCFDVNIAQSDGSKDYIVELDGPEQKK